MEQKSLRVLEGNKTFFSKMTTTLTKILIPTKLSMNNIMISIKRNALLKAYNAYVVSNDLGDSDKSEVLYKKYEESYTLYLEAIDKYIIDSVYKKVKNNTASSFERGALARYYTVVALKEKQYIEYKYKKQEYLMKLDFDGISASNKPSLEKKYNEFYVSKMDSLYKGLLKNYAIGLCDKTGEKLDVYDKIFNCLETYIVDVLPVKIKQNEENKENKEECKNIITEYDAYERAIIGKLDEKDGIRKKIAMLGISRVLFTHSLPLVAAEECYKKLIQDAREFLMTDSNQAKRNKTFEMLAELMEECHEKLLSTKVYWDRPEEREEYRLFWNQYQLLGEDADLGSKQSLLFKYDLCELNKESHNQADIIKLYKTKLVELGAMKEMPNKCKTMQGKYTQVKQVCEK